MSEHHCNDYCDCCQPKCCVISFAPRVYFFSLPKIKTWGINDGEVELYNEIVCLSGTKQIMVDASVTSGIVPSDNNVWVVYRLYVGGRQAAQGGYEGETAASSPSMQNVAITFGSNMSSTNSPNTTVRLTAEIKGPASAICYKANVDNKIGSFRGAKGAFLRIAVF